MIHNFLQPHIHNCLTHPGGAIAIDLFFKSNIKLHIILVYLSSMDMTKRTATQTTIINWIQSALQHNLHPIILGDFNTHNFNFRSSAKYRLINFLHHSNMYNVGAHFDNTHYTWSNNTYSSRIDYIWTDQFNIQFLLLYKLDTSDTSTRSDHLILNTSWTFPNAYSKCSHLHTGISHHVFNYKDMTSENWSEFLDLLSTKLNQHQTPLSLQTAESIDTIWHKIEHSIISTAIATIPNKVSCKRSYNHKYTPHSTQLYLSLKKLDHLIKNLKNTNITLDISSVNLQIQDINSRSQCNLQTLSSSDSAQILE